MHERTVSKALAGRLQAGLRRLLGLHAEERSVRLTEKEEIILDPHFSYLTGQRTHHHQKNFR